jgi:hypothetical protein
MVEPQHPGFTGAVWDAVPPEQLAHELTTGPGAAPVAETGLAYSGLSAGLGGAAAEFRSILSVIGDAWGSKSSEDGIAQMRGLADWFDEIATAARQNAETAAHQATSCEIAQVAMPHVAEVTQAVRTAQAMLHGSVLGAPLAGLLDTAEQQLDDMREQAAQVMRTYEAASEKMAHVWQQQHAPDVSDGANLLTEQSPGRSDGQPQGPPANAASVEQPALQLPMPQVDLSSLNVTPTVPVGVDSMLMPPVTPAMTTMTPMTAIAQPMTAVQPMTAAGPPPPMASPAPMTATAPTTTAATNTEPPTARAADAGGLGDQIAIDAGFATTPAVLGRGATQPAQRVHLTPDPEAQEAERR